MPRNLLDLPTEIIETCLKELLPPLALGPLCHVVLATMPLPTDLCRVMQVSKALHCLALPWVWRRVEICIGEVPQYRSRLLPGQWNYIRVHPEVAVHTRILRFQITQSEAIPQDLTAFLIMLGYIQNIRVLQLICHPTVYQILDVIYCNFISTPQIHTLIMSGYTPMDLRAVKSHPTLTNLRSLDIIALPWHVRLLEAAPCLESLSIQGDELSDVSCLTLPIPWESLREISLEDVEDWPLVFDNFSSWKKLHPDISFPLTEILVDVVGVDITEEDMQHISNDLRGQIERLHLVGFDSSEGHRLEQVVDTFPRLRDLRLLMGWHCSTWNIELSEVVKILGKLRKLRCLCWNYIDQPVQTDISFDLRDSELERRFQVILPALVQGCHALECVFFYEQESWTSFSIRRDGTGRYSDHVEDSGADGALFPTSSWDPHKYNHI